VIVASRQIKTYMLPDDRAAVEAFVKDELGSVLMAHRWPTPVPLEVSSGTGQSSLVCPASLIDELNPRHIAARDEWVLDPLTDPVVEWWYSKFSEDVLFPGRLYYVLENPAGENGTRKDDRFLSMADALFKWIRRSTCYVETEWGRERFGANAASSYRRGDLVLRRNPPGSRI
jgi:hypothetical protein